DVVRVVPDAVDVDGGQRQVAAFAAVARQPGDADAPERAAQALVLLDQLARYPGGGAAASCADVFELGVDDRFVLGDAGQQAHRLFVERSPLRGQRRQQGVERFGPFHQLELLVFELALPPGERLDLLL